MSRTVDVADFPHEVLEMLTFPEEPVLLTQNGQTVAVVTSPAKETSQDDPTLSARARSYYWINDNREALRQLYPGKTILVLNAKVVESFDGPINPLEINRLAKARFGDHDWAFTYLDRERTSLI